MTAASPKSFQISKSRYQMERKIFEELLELKRIQLRSGRTDESSLVRRMSDNYTKGVREMIGLKNYDGPWTFKDFEKYLYSKFYCDEYNHCALSRVASIS